MVIAMTLILARGANGKIVGRCDIRCYGGKNPRCRCICEGKNHGKGFNQEVIEQTARMLQKARKNHPEVQVRSPAVDAGQMLLW